jgi:hypothetical protein
MTNRFLITVALAILGAVMAAGAVSAQSSVLGSGGSDVSINLPNGGDLPVVGDNLPACSNGSDDDGDGTVDLQDPGCAGNPQGTDEGAADPAPAPPAGGDDGSGESPVPVPEVPVPGEDGGSGGEGGEGPNNLPDVDNPFGGGKDKDKSATFGEEKSGKKKDKADEDDNGGTREPDKAPEIRQPDGTPTNANPSVTIAPLGAAPIGVPNVVIDQFTIPPFLIPIYQACGTQYGIPWQILASINRIETAFGTNLNVSSAGALGWMQFMPPTWEAYGVDANGDGRKDPFNPVDAICAAARYLKASGGTADLRGAIFAYNHADWYVDEVLLYAQQYGELPTGLIDSLTGLTEGAHFPVAAKARYADDISEREAIRRATPRKGMSGNAAQVITDSPTRRGIDIFAKNDAPVVAVNDGVITDIGKSKRLGRFIVLRDAYGNEYTYAGLGEISDVIPVPRERELSARDFDLVTPGRDGADNKREPADDDAKAKDSKESDERSAPLNSEDSRERLFALPERPANRDVADLSGQLDALLADGMPGYETFKSYFSGVLRFDAKTMDARKLRKGSKVVAGTVLGRIGEASDGVAPHVNFSIEPAGRGSRKIDPKPILDGWKLLEATAIYRANGKNPFEDSGTPIGQILLASKAQLQAKVLSDPRLEIYSCGREDIRTGQIDRRTLAMLAYLAERGFRPTVTSLKCGHSVYTTSGNVSAHSTGNAVDIAQVNGIPILGNQGRGSITEAVINDLLKLQGAMAPSQIISLMEMGGPTFAMGDHADHIHVGYTPAAAPGSENGPQVSNVSSMLEPDQWDKLLNRIGELDQPTVPVKPSKYALPAKGKKSKGGDKKGGSKSAAAQRASDAHLGE